MSSVENRLFRLITVAYILYLYHNFFSVVLMHNTANVNDADEKSKE